MARKKRKVPLRMCLACRKGRDKRELIRVIRTPEGEIELDFTGKKTGRGAYICPDLPCLQKAIKGKALQKSLQRTIPENITEVLKQKLEEEAKQG